MNIKKTVKKIVALSAGAGMIGMTLMGALAAAPDLADYPGFLISGGQFDGKIVVGANAAAEDIIGAIDVAAAMQAASTTAVPVGDSTTSTVLEGDAKKIHESGDILEIGENIGDVTNTLTNDDLSLLADGRITTQSGSTDYTQTIDLQPTGYNGNVSMYQDNHDVTGDFLKFAENTNMFTYEVTFTSGLESDVDGNNHLEDIEDKLIPLMGNKYSVVTATTSALNHIDMTLIAGDVVDTLAQGETKTYTVDGKDYEVTVLVIGSSGSDTTVRLLVNNEMADSMTAGDTTTLSNGLEVGVRDIIETTAYRESDPSSVVEFYLGANKVVIADAATGNSAGDGTIEVNNDALNKVSIDVRGSITATDARLDSITYTVKTDADYRSDIFVAPGQGVRELMDNSDVLLNPSFDIRYEGLTQPATNDIRLDASGDDAYDLVFTNRAGDEFSVPYLSVDSTDHVYFGDLTSEPLVFWENADNSTSPAAGDVGPLSANIAIGTDFLLSTDPASNNGDSYVLQWDDINTVDKTLRFSNLATGDTKTVSYASGTNYTAGADLDTATPTGDIQMGGKDFPYWLIDAEGTPKLMVDLDRDNKIAGVTQGGNETTTVNLVVKGGGILQLATPVEVQAVIDAAAEAAGTQATMSLTTQADDLDEGTAITDTWSVLTTAQHEVDLSWDGTGSSGNLVTVKNQDRDEGLSQYGAHFIHNQESSGADELVIEYPVSQVEAQVYVVGGEVSSSSSSTGGSTSTRVNVLSVGLAVLDTEIDYDDTNMIVVGGPCANSIAAELLGNPADCAEGFEAGMGMIRTFDTGDNVAVLVAGYSAADTVQSTQVLARAATETVDKLAGDSVEVVVAGANDVTVRAAMPAEEPAMADKTADETTTE